MNPTLHAARLGLSRGWTEFKHALVNPQEIGFTVVLSVAVVVVMYFQRDATLPGTSISLATATLPSVLGMLTAFNGLLGAVGSMAVEREDGTLLRAKALPQGMVGYLVGRIVSVSLTTVISVLVVLAAGLVLLPSVARTGPGGWLTLVWVLVLGLVGTLPLGAIIGAVSNSPQTAAGMSMLAVGGLTAISGIFYPLSALAGWLQALAHVFPLYWLGLGMRSALSPAGPSAEIGGSWHTLETVGVLGAWAVAGLLLAPPILRKMARRESGSLMQMRRDRALQRIG
ncbi:ABC transporter permease [Nonomuraea sp. CA-143628]|uniref:ABC transporter permease n=1 Tax=Nonomuraea sp. CA-143628 TaxID=3239997 RepID=UPI003D91C460